MPTRTQRGLTEIFAPQLGRLRGRSLWPEPRFIPPSGDVLTILQPGSEEIELASGEMFDQVAQMLERVLENASDFLEIQVERVQLEQTVQELSEQVGILTEQLEELSERRSVTICSLAPEPYELTKPIVFDVRPSKGEFVASFHDADIHVTGGTAQEAVDDAKAYLLDIFENLLEKPRKKLGPRPKRRLAVLEELIRRVQ